jgi:hypothetical protein
MSNLPDRLLVLLDLPQQGPDKNTSFFTDTFGETGNTYVIQENGYLYQDISKIDDIFKRDYLRTYTGIINFWNTEHSYTADIIDGRVTKICFTGDSSL